MLGKPGVLIKHDAIVVCRDAQSAKVDLPRRDVAAIVDVIAERK